MWFAPREFVQNVSYTGARSHSWVIQFNDQVAIIIFFGTRDSYYVQYIVDKTMVRI